MKNTDHNGYDVKPDEPPDKEILVWEIEPHLQHSDYDYMVERSWQEMLALVANNLEYFLERHDEAQLMEGVTIKFKLKKMQKSDYDEIVGE